MSEYLTSAILKRNSNKSVNYLLNLHDFICQCYTNLNPNSYGTHIQEYIRMSLNAWDVSASEERGDFKVGGKYFEVKASYLSQKNESYSMTHMRTWQRFNFYLCCFIDCDNNFKPQFYLIDKNITAKMKLSFMNGTPSSNVNNTNVEMRATVKVSSDNHKVLLKHNLLKDDTFEALREFVTDLRNSYNDENRKSMDPHSKSGGSL